MKTYEVIDQMGKSHFIGAKSKKQLLDFWVSEKPKKVILRNGIEPSFVI